MTTAITDRDRRMLTLLGYGLTITEVADRLQYSRDTLKSRLKVLRREFDVPTTAGLVAAAIRAGVIE